jgi:Ca-activated chloride channel homolog
MAMILQKISQGARILLIAILIFINGNSLFTQDAPKKEQDATKKPEVFSISQSVDLVNVFASVRNKKGTYITNLTQDDFTIKEDGRKQPISNFVREVDLPLTIGMIVDFSPSMQAVTQQLQIASRAFFNKMIRPGQDKVLIMKFRDVQRTSGRSMSYDGSIELLQDLTSNMAEIEKAANLIAWDGIGGNQWDAQFETMLADSIIFATRRFMMVEGRKALIVMGDGFHAGNHMEQAIQFAQEQDTQIYSIHISDPNFGASSSGAGAGFSRWGNMGGMGGGMGAAQNDTVYATNLQTFSGKTGGNYFEYSGKKSLDNIYKEIEEELRSQYSIGYAPPEENKNPGCRKLEVKVLKDGLTVHARERYCPVGLSAR